MKKRKEFNIEEETLKNFEHYAKETNRTLPELMIEATQQMIRRYSVEHTRSIRKQLDELSNKIEEMYQTVPEESRRFKSDHIM
jgi:coenzyme F420-reducing hydrogenase delta subunit